MRPVENKERAFHVVGGGYEKWAMEAIPYTYFCHISSILPGVPASVIYENLSRRDSHILQKTLYYP
jgi:hypothetical protein